MSTVLLASEPQDAFLWLFYMIVCANQNTDRHVCGKQARIKYPVNP